MKKILAAVVGTIISGLSLAVMIPFSAVGIAGEWFGQRTITPVLRWLERIIDEDEPEEETEEWDFAKDEGDDY